MDYSFRISHSLHTCIAYPEDCMTKNITCEKHWVGTNANIEYYYLIILLSKTRTERDYLTEKNRISYFRGCLYKR